MDDNSIKFVDRLRYLFRILSMEVANSDFLLSHSFNRKRDLSNDDLCVLSAGNHKMAALFYDKIYPMHSMGKVPSKYQVNIALPREFKDLVKLFNSVSYSPVDSVTMLNGSLIFDMLSDCEAYRNIFEIAYGKNVKLDIIEAFEFIRDAVTLLYYETATICGYKMLPIFNNGTVFMNFLKYGGFFIKPDEIKIDRPVIEVVQENYYELIQDRTSWQQIRETKKDYDSLLRIRAINQMFKISNSSNDKERIKYNLDKTMEDFEESIKKHGLQFKRAKQHLFLDIASTSSLGLLSILSTMCGLPTSVTISAISGMAFSTAKTAFTFKEIKTATKLSNYEIAKYIQAAKEDIENKFETDTVSNSEEAKQKRNKRGRKGNKNKTV